MDCIIQKVFTFPNKFLFSAIYLFVVDWLKQLTFFLLKLVEVKYQAVSKPEGSKQGSEPFESSVFVGDGDELFVVEDGEDTTVKGVGDDEISSGELRQPFFYGRENGGIVIILGGHDSYLALF